MALTVSTPYKTNTVASVSGTQFISNGTPFVAGDVGRFIRFTDGAAYQQIRRIVTYVSTTEVTVDVAWNTGYFVADGFTDSLPTAGNTWVMSYTLDDIDNGADIVKSTNGNHFRFAASVTLSGTTFVADENRQVDLAAGSDFVILATTACFMLGSMHPNGYAQNGCSLVDNSGGAIIGGWTGSSSHGNSGDLHLYGCNITSVGANLFWRLYRGTQHVVRFVSCDFYGNLGMRLQGTESIIKDCKFIGNFSSIGPFGPISPFGLISGVEIRNCLRGARYVYNLGVGDIFGPRFSDLTNGVIETVSGDAAGKIIGVYDYVQSELVPYPFVSGQANAASGVDWYQYIDTAIVDSTLSAITDTARRVIKDVGGTTKNDATTTSGAFARYNALVNSMRATSTGNKAWSFGTIYAPFAEAVASYKWQTANLSLPLETSSDVAFTMVPDAYVTQQTIATVDAYTEITNLDRFYDRYKSWFVTNLATVYPTFGGQKLTGDGTTLDCGSANVVVDATAGSAFAVNTGTNTITIKASTLSEGVTFSKLKSTGTLTLANGATVSDTMVVESAAGISVPVMAPNIIAGSRIQIYNVTDAVEVANEVLSGAGYAGRVTYTGDKVFRLRAAYTSGVTAMTELESSGVLSASGISFIATQVPCPVYNTNAIDGSTVTEFSADYPTVHIDIADGDGVTSVRRLYAFWKYNLTTADGVSDFFGGLVPDDLVNYKIVTSILDLKLDNTNPSPVRVYDGRLYRDDGTTVIAATSGSIQMDPDKAYLAQSAEVTAIKAKTDNLPSDPADQSLLLAAIGAPLQAVAYIAPDNAGISAIKAKTDALTITAGNVHATVATMNEAEVIGTGTEGDAWRGAGVAP